MSKHLQTSLRPSFIQYPSETIMDIIFCILHNLRRESDRKLKKGAKTRSMISSSHWNDMNLLTG